MLVVVVVLAVAAAVLMVLAVMVVAVMISVVLLVLVVLLLVSMVFLVLVEPVVHSFRLGCAAEAVKSTHQDSRCLRVAPEP